MLSGSVWPKGVDAGAILAGVPSLVAHAERMGALAA